MKWMVVVSSKISHNFDCQEQQRILKGVRGALPPGAIESASSLQK